MKNDGLISINDIITDKRLIEFNLTKSQIHYWTRHGLLEPVYNVGKMNIFNRENVVKKIKELKKLQEKGLKLNEIKIKLN